MEEKQKKFFSGKKKKWFLIAGIAIVIVVAFFVFRGKNGSETVFAEAKMGDVVSEVSVTGKVVPSKSVELAFEKGGRVKSIPVKVGSSVGRGDILMQLENGDLLAQITQAQATLKSQEAKLQELKRGSRPEEIAIKETELKRAEQDLDNDYRSIRDILNDAYAKADDVVRTKIDDIFTDDDTANPKLTFTTSNAQAEIDIIAMRYRSGLNLENWRSEMSKINSDADYENLMSAVKLGEKNLASIRDFLTRILDAVDGAIGLSATTVSTYKSNIYTARTNVNTTYTSLSTQEQTIDSQKIIVQKTKNELDLMKAGSTSEQILAQEAQVEQARGNEMYYRTQYEKTVLRAPFAGTVTKIVPQVGDIVAQSPVIGLIGTGTFEIETYLTESDVVKVKKGNSAKVTFDAYGQGMSFEASVIEIDLSETIKDGVPNYKTRLAFKESDTRIIPGLTADADILIEKKENVLYVPTRNLLLEDGIYFVNRLIGDENKKESEKIEVKTGLGGSDGRTEILSGLNNGDRISVE